MKTQDRQPGRQPANRQTQRKRQSMRSPASPRTDGFRVIYGDHIGKTADPAALGAGNDQLFDVFLVAINLHIFQNVRQTHNIG
jgi:hypothetical protein